MPGVVRQAAAGVLLVLLGAAHAQHPPGGPRLHFAPARNWMNDPNGLVYDQGEYHLFFQYNPYGDRWGHMNWGHAVSRDLVDWQELGIAIPETDVMAFSGSAVIDRDNTSGFSSAGHPAMVAIYTGSDELSHNQSQFLAYSTDRGRHFTRYGKILDIGSNSFRDPKVFWHAPTRRWVMAAVMASDNRVVTYLSSDLKHWSPAGSFGPAGMRGRDWECPDLFELPVQGGEGGETRWVLLVSVGEHGVAGGSGVQYFVGDFDGANFVPVPGWGAAPRWVDHGADFYAAATWNDLPSTDARRLLIAWAADWRYANAIPTQPSRGLMTLVRELTLRKDAQGYFISQAPVRELARYRDAPPRRGSFVLHEAPVPLPAVGTHAELEVAIDTQQARQVVLALNDGEGHQTLIGLNPAVNEVFLDRTRSGAHFHDAFEDRHVARVDLANHKVRLHVVVDQSILELFVNDGSPTITDRFFPAKGALAWSAWSSGSPARLELTTWSLVQP